ncbi:MAG: hypothetical protein AAGI45_09110 [Cyanobacteria bacterium P01_H01_bin.26]
MTTTPWLNLLTGLGLWCSLSPVTWAQTTLPGPQPAPAEVAQTSQIRLPPVEDVPEEILRTEIIFEARSPLDGTPISPADYAQLQTELAAAQTTRTLNTDIRRSIFLLQVRRVLKPIIPFIP